MTGQSLLGSLKRPAIYAKDRAREIIRGLIPPHVRFIRAGKSFLQDGEREVHLLPKLVLPGTTTVDVGAHLGDYTYALCQLVGPDGHVIAIEPIADMARNLAEATRHLKLPVTVINCALSTHDGTAELLIPNENGRPRTGYATLEPRQSQGVKQKVSLRRLDDVCKDVDERISFIKIDVEGHELSVLQGGVQTLRKHRPNLLIEIEQRHSSIPITETLKWIESADYRGEFLGIDGIPLPLSTFDVDQHQTSRLNQVGKPGYVSNFIFYPV
jgi:FkbM family methyltransferase